MSIETRAFTDRDFFAWLDLFGGYCEFYGTSVTDEKALTVWSWLTSSNKELEGVAATEGGELIGFAHFRAEPDSLSARRELYLDDLYVMPDKRRNGAGDILLDAVRETARSRGFTRIRWITADDNDEARRLYDRRAEPTTWVTYEWKVDA